MTTVGVVIDAEATQVTLPLFIHSDQPVAATVQFLDLTQNDAVFDALLFADPELRANWTETRERNPQHLIWLRIDNDALELHAPPWELLRKACKGAAPQILVPAGE